MAMEPVSIAIMFLMRLQRVLDALLGQWRHHGFTLRVRRKVVAAQLFLEKAVLIHHHCPAYSNVQETPWPQSCS